MDGQQTLNLEPNRDAFQDADKRFAAQRAKYGEFVNAINELFQTGQMKLQSYVVLGGDPFFNFRLLGKQFELQHHFDGVSDWAELRLCQVTGTGVNESREQVQSLEFDGSGNVKAPEDERGSFLLPGDAEKVFYWLVSGKPLDDRRRRR